MRKRFATLAQKKKENGRTAADALPEPKASPAARPAKASGVPLFAQRKSEADVPVQRDGDGVLPPVPSFQLTPPSLLQPRTPGLPPSSGFQFRLNPEIMTMMRAQAMERVFQLLDPQRIRAALAQFNPAAAGPGAQPPSPTSPTSPPTATPSATPSAPPPTPPLVMPGPSEVSFGVVWSMITSHPVIDRLVTDAQSRALSQLRSLSPAEKVALISVTGVMALGSLGVLATDPRYRRAMLDTGLGAINGNVIGIPGTPVGIEFNLQSDNLFVGLHFDLGSVLSLPWGSADLLGPQPMSSPQSPPPPLERSAEPGAGDALPAQSFEQLGQRILAASSGGSPLSDDVRERLEGRLGADLSGVKLHTDSEADHLARSVHAVAFTTGQDIFLRAGAYEPDSPEGMRLLAHEVVHTQQQASGPVAGTPVPGGVAVSHPSDSFEREAERVAEQVTRRPEREAESSPAHPTRRTSALHRRHPQPATNNEPHRQAQLVNVQRDDGGAGGAGGGGSSPDSGSQSPPSGGGDALRRIIFGQTILHDVKPLSSDESSQLGQSIAHAPVYVMMRERDEKHARLKDLIEEVKRVEGAQPTAEREHEIDQLAERVSRLDTEIQGALSALGLSEENIVEEVQSFVNIWLERGKQIAYTMLDKSLETVQAEEARYQIEETIPEDIGGLKLADQHLAEIALDIEEQPALDELKRIQREMGPAEYYEGSDFDVRYADTYKRKLELQAELRPKYEALKAQVGAYGSKYPVIFDPHYVAGSFQTMSDEEVSQATGQWLEELAEKIENTRARIGDEVKVWDLRDIPELAFSTLNVPPNSVLGVAVRERIKKEKSDAGALKDALVAIGIGAGLLAVVATGGAALAFGAIAAGATGGASVVSLIDDLKKYVVQSDAQGIMLDPALNEIFAQGDPQLLNIVMDLVAVGVSLLTAGLLAKPIKGAVQEFLASRKSAEALENFVSRAMGAGLDESQARSLAARVMDPTKPLSSAGMKGALAEREGCGVFLRNIPQAPEPVAVKVYPASLQDKFELDMAGARAAAATGKGPKFYGEVQMEAGKKAFATEYVVGGFTEEMAVSTATQAEVATATQEAAFYASKVTSQTITDVEDYAQRLLREGYFYQGEVQGLVTPKGNWVPIDTQAIRPLPPQSDAAAYAEALRRNASAFKLEKDALASLAAQNRAGVAPP